MDVRVRKDNRLSRAYTQGGIQIVQKKLKINVIITLVHWAVKICSPVILKDQFDNLRRILANNGYPLDVINTTIAKVTDPRNEPTHTVNNESGK